MSGAAEPVACHAVSAALGESPVWCSRTGKLWFVDIRAPALFALEPVSGRLERFPMPELTGMVALALGGLVVGVGCRLHRFDPLAGRLDACLVVLDIDRPGNRINDTKAGPDGALWCGTMRDGGRVPSGRLHHVTADGRSRELLDGLFCPNSLAFAPDGRTLYVTDTRKGDILQARADADRLELRPFAAADIAPGRPDGSTVDAEGCLWNTRTGGGQLIRLAADGRLLKTLRLPVSQPTACAFGGADLATLYVTTARQRLTPEQLAAEPLAGDLLAFDVGVKGLPEHRYAA